MKSLVSKKLEAGYHTITWQPDGLPSGIYFAKLKATIAPYGPLQAIDFRTDSYTDTKKLILLR